MGRWAVRVPWGDEAMGRWGDGAMERLRSLHRDSRESTVGERCEAGGARRAARCGRCEAGGAWLTAAVWDPLAVGHAHRRWHRRLDRVGRSRLQFLSNTRARGTATHTRPRVTHWRWGVGAMGRWGDGAVERWCGEAPMGRWGDGAVRVPWGEAGGER